VSFVATRAAIAKFFRASLPGASVFEHGGAFDLAELKRVAAQTPALAVSCLGVPAEEVQGGTMACDVQFALFAIAANTSKAARDVAVLVMVESILTDLPTQKWGNAANKVPQGIAATNLYSSALDKQGVSLWAVRWRQEVDLEKTVWSTLDDLLRVYTTTDLAPLVDVPEHEDAYDRVTLPAP